MRTFIKVVILLLIAIAAILVFAYSQRFVRTVVFGNQYPRSYLDMVSCALAGSLAASIIVSIPIAATFRRKPWLAASAVSLPMLGIRLNELFTYTGPFTSQVRVMAVVEAGSYLAFLVAGSLLASTIWKQSDNHSNSHRPAT